LRLHGSGSDEQASDEMDGWDIALLVVAGYVAVTALVRLMLRRRDQVVEALRRQAEQRAAAKRGSRRKQPSDAGKQAA